MIKLKHGWIGTDEGLAKDLVVKAVAPNTIRDALIGGAMVMVGITYLTATAFKHGCDKFEAAEMATLSELGLIDDLK